MDEGYAYLIGLRDKAAEDIRNCKKRMERCEDRLSRLRPVKDALREKKAQFRSIQTQDTNTIQEGHIWQGETHERFLSKGNHLLAEDASFLDAGLDCALDEINNEITRQENKYLHEYGLLGDLVSLFNSLANQVENYFN